MDRTKIKAAMLARMEELGMNVATLARQSGLSYDTPRDFLIRDKAVMPAADKLVAMLQVLGLTHLLMNAAATPSRNGLRAMRERRGYTIEELAALLPRGTAKDIRKLEVGGPLSHDWKNRLASALECRPDDLDAPLPVAPKKKVDAQGLSDRDLSWKAAPKKKNGKRHAFTDSKGWTAYYEEFLPGVPYEFLGKLCVVKTEDKKIRIRRIQPGQSPGRYLLESMQGPEKPIKEAFVLASALVVLLKQA